MSRNSNNKNQAMPIDSNCDINVMSPTSSINESTIESQKSQRSKFINCKLVYLNEFFIAFSKSNKH